MKNIVLVPNLSKDKADEVTTRLVDKLDELGFELYSASKYCINFPNKVVPYDELPKDTDLIIVVGVTALYLMLRLMQYTLMCL